ncbi:MAG: DinB family protein [Gemmatimonadetes bacterium]|nr:DinB family protein [Gemmatimonadota bacterium]
MQSQLATAVERFQVARERLHRLAAALPEEKWNVRRLPASWSVAECVAHLNLTSQAYLPLLRDGIDRARALGTAAPERYRLDLVGGMIALAAGPMPRIGSVRFGRSRTTPAFVPSGVLPRGHLLAEFDRLQEAQVALTAEADGLPLDQVKVASPFDARARYNLYSCFVILPRHQQRHLEQAERVWSDAA